MQIGFYSFPWKGYEKFNLGIFDMTNWLSIPILQFGLELYMAGVDYDLDPHRPALMSSILLCEDGVTVFY